MKKLNENPPSPELKDIESYVQERYFFLIEQAKKLEEKLSEARFKFEYRTIGVSHFEVFQLPHTIARYRDAWHYMDLCRSRPLKVQAYLKKYGFFDEYIAQSSCSPKPIIII